MSEGSTTSTQHDKAHAHPSYVKIWAILLALLVVSVLGPTIGIEVVTLVTAFGVAVVKAYLVARNFMHLNVEPRYIAYLLTTCVVFMLLLFAGVAPDVMKHAGRNWTNAAAQAEVNRAMSHPSEGPGVAPAPVSPEVAFRSTCAPCHGTHGDGTGPAAAALNPHPANFTAPEFWQTRDEAHIANVILHGGASVGRSSLMPSFQGRFDEEGARGIATYIAETFRPAEAAANGDGGVIDDGGLVDGAALPLPQP